MIRKVEPLPGSERAETSPPCASTTAATIERPKYYVRGIGTVLEQTVKGRDERNTLASIRRP